MADNLAVQSKVRELVRSLELRMSADAIEALSKEVQSALEAAGERCKGNGRQTIRPSDF